MPNSPRSPRPRPQEQWKTLEDRALWILEHAEQTSPCVGTAPLFRLWHYPSIGAQNSWSVILSVRDHPLEMPRVRAVIWDRTVDWRRMTAPLEALKRGALLKPSIRIEDASVFWGDLAPFLRTALGLTTSASTAGSPVVPGEDVFGIEGFGSMAHLRLKWSGRGPSEWIEIIEWVARFRSLLVRSIRERAMEPVTRSVSYSSRDDMRGESARVVR